MPTVQTGLMTADEFWEWCCRPENAGKRVELVRGRIVEVSSPGEVHGILCGWIACLLWLYAQRRGAGAVATNDTGLVVGEEPDSVRGPDVVLFAESVPLEQLSRKHSRRIPRLVVEVVSPNDKPNKITQRVGEYLRRGVPLVWIVDPADRTVGVHRMNELPKTLDNGDTLTGEEVLPDLQIPVADLFKLPGV